MYKKRLMLLIIIALVLTGCTRIDNNIDVIVNATMSKENSSVNTGSTSYELYVPMGVIQLVDNEYNQKFRIHDTHVYLYVDTISYYYKNSLNYRNTENYNHYYKEINLNNKTGYIGVNKIDNGSFFVEIVYNYAKIEFYTNEVDLPVVMANSLIMINSIKYNDNLIKMQLEDTSGDGREVKYELDKPEDSESTFSQFLQEYVEEDKTEVVLPDAE